LKKKVVIGIIIGVIIGFILPFPVLRNAFNQAMAPDKILVAGNQIDAYSFQFTKEIRDKEKIADFEKLFDEIAFVEEPLEEASYPDLIVQINHKRGIWTHPLRIWFDGEEGIAQQYTIEKPMIGRLSGTQVRALQEIFK
jgi:hypothetical protein